jgi:hypothetical protein
MKSIITSITTYMKPSDYRRRKPKKKTDEEKKAAKAIKAAKESSEDEPSSPAAKESKAAESSSDEEPEVKAVKSTKRKANDGEETKSAKVAKTTKVATAPKMAKSVLETGAYRWVRKYVLDNKLKKYENVIEDVTNSLLRKIRRSIEEMKTTVDKSDDDELYMLIMDCQWAVNMWPKAVGKEWLKPEYNETFPISIFHSDKFKTNTIAAFRADL